MPTPEAPIDHFDESIRGLERESSLDRAHYHHGPALLAETFRPFKARLCGAGRLTGRPGGGDPKKHVKKPAAAVHPNAPAGGGGPGRFRDAQCLNGAASAACADTPASRNSAPKTPAAKPPPKAVTKPPPPTRPRKSTVLKRATKHEDIELYVEVVEDTSNSSLDSSQAETTSNWADVQTTTPAYDYVDKGKQQIVSAINGKVEIKGTITVQTAYGSDAKPTDTSQYGRGTTSADEKSGQTTLGFHENNHQQDYLNYLANHPLPEFTGKIGMTVDQYQAAADRFQQAMTKYQQAMEADSEQRTDQVGYTKSTFDRSGARRH
jgi:hypothetical protein